MRNTGVARTALLLLSAALIGGGCGDSAEPSLPSITGNYGGPLVGAHGVFMGVSLRESGGVITGLGWFPNVPNDSNPTITGLLDGSSVSLTFHHLTAGTFSYAGTWTHDTLSLTPATPSPSPLAAILTRIDTIPSGHATLSIRGALTREAAGDALFLFLNNTYNPSLIIQTRSPFAATLFVKWSTGNRPGVGTHRMSDRDILDAELVLDPNSQGQTISRLAAGAVVIEHSNRITLAGSLNVSATLPSGESITITGRFSAGCLSEFC